ncbi:MAG: hypothetical protein K2X99_00520 [Gemmatimonadaceae bacterium]|nr:hypothetical protein [Gemmatimonadaceae bacterium]
MITIVPTLVPMAAVYRLARTGGPRSPRFAAYVQHAQSSWGFAAYNPMAGDHARDTVDALVALDAERIVAEEATRVAGVLAWRDPITLAVVVASPGMWTDRLATETLHRTHGERRAGHGLVTLWAREEMTAALVRREAAAETVRTIWHAQHGVAHTVATVVAREGLAYAMAGELPTLEAEVADAVAGAFAVVRESDAMGDAVALLFGDDAASAQEWPTIGIAERAGERWAVRRAHAALAAIGAAAAMRAGARGIIPERP